MYCLPYFWPDPGRSDLRISGGASYIAPYTGAMILIRAHIWNYCEFFFGIVFERVDTLAFRMVDLTLSARRSTMGTQNPLQIWPWRTSA